MIIKKRSRTKYVGDKEKPKKRLKVLKMVAGSFYHPKDNPKKPRGEDACFICDDQQTMGVADGVGGWAKKGIDAGEYARELMTEAMNAVQHEPSFNTSFFMSLRHLLFSLRPSTMIIKKRSRTKYVGDKEKPKKRLKVLKMVAGSFYHPKDNPKKPRGEDACFICDDQQTMGVADGVGGWAKKGIDAGEYARELMTEAMNAVQHEPKGFVDPRKVLNDAFLNTKARGSSTASIVTLKEGVLHGVNVGDSGLMLFRENRLFYRSRIQQHCFNTPFQLGNSEISDSPDSAIEYKVPVKAGDILVLGSDGLFDNLYADDIEEILMNSEGILEVNDLAEHIAEIALFFSRSKHYRTPFQDASHREGHNHMGGKKDDITVLVAQITV